MAKWRGKQTKAFTPSTNRSYLDPVYQEWRDKVRTRDGFKCQMPNCIYKGKKLHCHHILPWATNPMLRFDPSNGICLCPDHHKLVTGKESAYASLFISIVGQNERKAYSNKRHKRKEK